MSGDGRVPFADLPDELRELVKTVCRRCGTRESLPGGSFGFGNGTWSHVLCSPPVMADVCDCGDWEAQHALRRGGCWVCDCQRYVFWRQERMPPAMYAGAEPCEPTAVVRPRYVDADRVEAALADHFADLSMEVTRDR